MSTSPSLIETPPERQTSSKHVPGEAGIWVFIGGDILVFSALFLAFLYDRSDSTALYAQSQQALDQSYGAINTVLLLVSSLFVALAMRGLRQATASPRKLQGLVIGAIACGLGFSTLKVVEYVEKASHDISPWTNEFFMYYFALTGLHWFHLMMGLAMLVIMVRMARLAQFTKRQFVVFESGATFWHMIDLVWIVLFPLLYLVK